MNVFGIVILVALIVVVVSASRRWALLGMIAGVLFLTQGQQVNILGLNLFSIRFLELAAFFRVAGKQEFSFRKLNKIDKTFLLLYIYSTVVFLLRSPNGQAFQIGVAVDAFLCYFTFKGLLTGIDDLRWLLRALPLLLVPYAAIVLVESFAHHNLFTLIGGIEGGSKWTRNGRPRCFGSFRQPDTLGMFGASFLPLYVGLCFSTEERKRFILGIVLCVILAWASNSGGPAAATAIALVAWMFWRIRTRMRMVRLGIVFFLVTMAVAMKAPIWYIFAHLSSITGGDGWHRSYLIDVSYQHLGQWWFDGMPIENTAGWFPYDLSTTGGADITNQFIAFGLTAGLATIVLFILLLVRAFSMLGKALGILRSDSNNGNIDGRQYLLWGLGSMLVVHIVNWFGITYFDQMYVIWFMQLAAISTLSDNVVIAQSLLPKETDEQPRETNDFSQIPIGGVV